MSQRVELGATLADVLSQIIEPAVEHAVRRVLRADEHVDQRSTPAGARRFIAAIRSGKLKGTRAGRRWIATREDHAAWLASLNADPAKRAVKESVTSELARELRLVR